MPGMECNTQLPLAVSKLLQNYTRQSVTPVFSPLAHLVEVCEVHLTIFLEGHNAS